METYRFSCNKLFNKKVRNISDKYTIEKLKETCNKKGYYFLTDDISYKNNKQKFDFIDKDGFLYYVSYNNLTRSKKLDKYGKLNPYHIYNLNNFIKINKLNVVLINEDFSGIREKVDFRCGCGNVFSTTINEFLYNNKNKCNICTKKERWNINRINQYIKDNKLNIEILSKQYKNNENLLEWKCSCGKTFIRSWNHVKQGFIKCKSCSNKEKSTLENKLEEQLIKNNINFKKQWKFKDCKNLKTLSFDFAILNNDNLLKILIECDGIQHFQPVDFFGGEESFKKSKLRDLIKDEYCKEHGIKLLRIPYWEFKNNNYIKILQENL